MAVTKRRTATGSERAAPTTLFRPQRAARTAPPCCSSGGTPPRLARPFKFTYPYSCAVPPARGYRNGRSAPSSTEAGGGSVRSVSRVRLQAIRVLDPEYHRYPPTLRRRARPRGWWSLLPRLDQVGGLGEVARQRPCLLRRQYGAGADVQEDLRRVESAATALLHCDVEADGTECSPNRRRWVRTKPDPSVSSCQSATPPRWRPSHHAGQLGSRLPVGRVVVAVMAGSSQLSGTVRHVSDMRRDDESP